MIAQLSKGSGLLVMLVMGLGLCLAGCKKKKEKPFPPAPVLSGAATTEGAAIPPASSAAGLIPVAASALPAPADTLSPPDRSAFEELRSGVAELDSMVKRGVFTNPDKPGEGDANIQCQQLETARSRVEALADPEAKKLIAEEKRLCGLEVPLLSADRTLRQLTISPSQASRQLMCKFVAKDLDKARAVNKNDRRVRELEGRVTRACNR